VLGGESAMKKLFFLVVLTLVTFISAGVWAECALLTGSSGWDRMDAHKVKFYRGTTGLAVLEIPNYDIYPRSEIHLKNDYVCNGDTIIIDGAVCDITLSEVKRLDGGTENGVRPTR